MKTHMHWGKRHFVFLGIIILGLASFSTAHAQTPTTLYSFTGGSDGSDIQTDLTLSGSTLYGTAEEGGSGYGTVYSLPVTGGTPTILYSFTNSGTDGAYPDAGLTLSGSTLYGTTAQGGSSGAGTVFSVPVTGGPATTLYSFTGSGTDGNQPISDLVLSGSTLYGTTQNGGSSGYGNVFSEPVTGGPATTLYSFTGSGTDGANPQAGLVLSGSTLYGMTTSGGADGYGTVFSVPVTGGSETTLYSFTGSGTDGAYPQAGLILVGSELYGTTALGGADDEGTVFSVPVAGGSEDTLYSFTGSGTDGAVPESGLTLDGSDLYGTTDEGGTSGVGTVFSVPVTGGAATTLYSFTESGTDGGNPVGGLVLGGSTLYGTTIQGGADGHGTVFALDLAAAPEPSSWTLLLVGMGVLAWVRRRQVMRNGQV